MPREIDYGNLMHSAMRGLIKAVLQDVAENGLPGAHHFFTSIQLLERSHFVYFSDQVRLKTRKL